MKLREILKSIWEDFLDAIQDVYLLYKIRFPKDSKVDIYGWINQTIHYLTPILLVVIIVLLVRTPPSEVTYINYESSNDGQIQTSTQSGIEQDSDLGKLAKETITTECKRKGVDENLVYTIINSPDPTEDRWFRVGVMKLHPDVTSKYDDSSRGPGVMESIYSNIVAGVDRLAWALDKNETLEGALMVYIYTKPEAQKMWNSGIKTTDWVEEVKGKL